MTQQTELNLGGFIIRISLGVVMLAHGLLKVLFFGLSGTIGFFDSLGLPAMAAYVTICAELGGGYGTYLGPVFTPCRSTFTASFDRFGLGPCRKRLVVQRAERPLRNWLEQQLR